ncbi:TrmH family RNA methyltransferase [Candidatus Neptunochlamydia vexilliferae]|uniref:TrmH family RNA methyltransferase n=1 Tax=Candidatus Neptunichlamydia vexilliferae TaxID=1651774 RepID=UPI001891CCF7|nr:RNA methyltransferase [Candidatus Neptunochlamydia vexilliferae]
MKPITSLQNPRVKQAVKLRQKRERDRTSTFLIEGYRELSRAIQAKVPIEIVFYSPDHFLGTNETTLLQNVDALEVSKEVFEKMSYRDRPDGLLAIAQQVPKTLADLNLPEERPPFLLIAEAIEKPGNLGTILRSSDAAGVDALLVCDRCTDIYNPNVVRASVGTLFTVPVLEVSSDETIAWLERQNIPIVATSPDAQERYTTANLAGPVAIAMGTEQLGLSKKWMDAASLQVSIPMCGVADSLNVASATTLLLYEVLRQRS